MSKSVIIGIVVVAVIIGGVFWIIQGRDMTANAPSGSPITTSTSNPTPTRVVCAANQHSCPCATGNYCLSMGAMCISPNSACPPPSGSTTPAQKTDQGIDGTAYIIQGPGTQPGNIEPSGATSSYPKSPLANGTIIIQEFTSSSPNAELKEVTRTTTDSQGNFRISVQPGTYYASTLGSLSEEVKVSAGAYTKVDFTFIIQNP